MEDIIITIRRMEEADAYPVSVIEADAFSEPWSEKAFIDAVKNNTYIYLVAEHKEEIVGYAGCIISCEDADITNIAVKENYRRIGIAAKLMELLASEAAKKGARSIFLEVRKSNEPAKELYALQGFEAVGMRKNFYRMPAEDAIIMEKKIQC